MTEGKHPTRSMAIAQTIFILLLSLLFSMPVLALNGGFYWATFAEVIGILFGAAVLAKVRP